MLTNKDSITIHLSLDEAASIADFLRENMEWFVVGDARRDIRDRSLTPLAKLYDALSAFAAGN